MIEKFTIMTKDFSTTRVPALVTDAPIDHEDLRWRVCYAIGADHTRTVVQIVRPHDPNDALKVLLFEFDGTHKEEDLWDVVSTLLTLLEMKRIGVRPDRVSTNAKKSPAR